MRKLMIDAKYNDCWQMQRSSQVNHTPWMIVMFKVVVKFKL
jgi:hypothetical protein